jgi:hypothetical protein
VEYYRYHNRAGRVVYRVVRTEPKGFRIEHPTPSGQWRRGYGSARRVLYHLPQILQSALDRPVFIMEGEKDVHWLTDLGYVATTCPNGAHSFAHIKGHARKALKRRDIILLPHNDEGGEHHARSVVAALAGAVRSIRIVRLPGLPEHGDVADWLQAGHFFTELEQLIQASPFTDPTTVRHVTPTPSARTQDDNNWVISVPTHIEHRVTRRALMWPFVEQADGTFIANPELHLEEFCVSLRSPSDAPMSDDAIRALARDITPWWSVAATAIVALAHEGRDAADRMGPGVVSLSEVAKVLRIGLRYGKLRERDYARVLDVIRLLKLVHLKGTHLIAARNQYWERAVDGHFVEIEEVQERDKRGLLRTTAIKVTPGPWYHDYVGPRNFYFAVVSARLFGLRPSHWHEQALGLSFAEQWRTRVTDRAYGTPSALSTMLADAGIPVRAHDPKRFAQEIEDALRELVNGGDVHSATCTTPLPSPLPGWWCGRWQYASWVILPPKGFCAIVESRVYPGRPITQLPADAGTFLGCLSREHDTVPSNAEQDLAG